MPDDGDFLFASVGVSQIVFAGHDFHAVASFPENKAGNTATPVACGWAGAVLKRSTEHLGRSSRLKKLKNAEKVKRGTDRPTN